ncbi:MAG: hypothetical protein NC302_08410 [Bacteroidales bacterium]|nr:hypothetical protein [Bacteroidales bacterium]MCM1415758.1 hypothetical protein [bacterium]MCM1424296.1 hypothetical protein [bacterium]
MKMKLIVLVLGLILLSAVGLFGCGKKELTRMSTSNSDLHELPGLILVDENGSPIESTKNEESGPVELIALAETREEAEEIAELYEIDLSAYSYGVATYTTDKDVQELIAFGTENGYPELSVNRYDNKLHAEP